MFDGISDERILKMSMRERRWLDNLKKAFQQSDLSFQTGMPEDRCLEEIFKGIDTAKTLWRSLRGMEISRKNNKKQFLEFVGLEVPFVREDKKIFELLDQRSGKVVQHSFGDVIYDIRCMTHENENLNAAEDVDYHVLLDWSVRHPKYFAVVESNRIKCNGYFLWNRLREILATFITGIDATFDIAEGRSFSLNCRPSLGSIRSSRHGR